MRVFITGGTTGTPKLIRRSKEIWNGAIKEKAKMFATYGIGAADRVVVLHPAAPWAIGHVFQDGATEVGAETLLLGLAGIREEMRPVLQAFSPTVVCGPGRLILRVASEMRDCALSFHPKLAFTGGEPLSPGTRKQLLREFNIKAVDVYGMAEFEMVGFEIPQRPGNLQLIGGLSYALRVEGERKLHLLEPGQSGELTIQRSGDDWHYTGDSVVAGTPLGTGEPTIRLLGRLLNVGMLCDGSQMSALQLQCCANELNLEFIQARITHRRYGDEVELWWTEVGNEPSVSPQQVVEQLMATNIDVGDAVQDGAITSITAKYVKESELTRTHRGKLANILEIEE